MSILTNPNYADEQSFDLHRRLVWAAAAGLIPDVETMGREEPSGVMKEPSSRTSETVDTVAFWKSKYQNAVEELKTKDLLLRRIEKLLLSRCVSDELPNITEPQRIERLQTLCRALKLSRAAVSRTLRKTKRSNNDLKHENLMYREEVNDMQKKMVQLRKSADEAVLKLNGIRDAKKTMSAAQAAKEELKELKPILNLGRIAARLQL